MPAILEPDVATAPKKRRFMGSLRHYLGDAPPPKQTLGGMMSQFEGRPAYEAPPSILPPNPQDAAIGEGFGKLGLERRGAEELAKGGQLLSNAEDTGEIVLSDQVPKMPPRPGGATSEPMPEDRPAAKSGPTPQQARMQAEMDSAAESITGREASALESQRASVRTRASNSLNSPAGDLFSEVGPAEATAENASGVGSKIRTKLAGVESPGLPGAVGNLARKVKGGVSQAAESVGGILEKIPGVARTGRIAERLMHSPAMGLVGKYGIPLEQAWQMKNDWQSGRMEPTTEIDPETDAPYRNPDTGEPIMVNTGHYEPNEEDLANARSGGNSILGAPLMERYDSDTNIPFTDTKIPWARGIIPDVAGELVGAALGGPIGGAAMVGRQVAKAGAALYKGYDAKSKAREERKASEEKYGTVEKATATRHKMETERAETDKTQARIDFLTRMRDDLGLQFDLKNQ